MFDVALTFFSQLCECIPFFIGLYVLFDLMGSLLFNKR